MSDTTYGWDDSHYGDIPTARDGIDLYTHKLTDGNRFYEDAEYRPAMEAARALGVPILGPYHVLHGGVSVTEQADWLLARATTLTPWWKTWEYWTWQVDAEPFDYLRRPSIAEVNAFGVAVAERARCPLSSVLGYVAAWSYGTQVQQLRLPFWHANYGTNPVGPYRSVYPGNVSTRWVGGGRRADLLQYGSNTIIAGQPTSDANAFPGSLAQLKAFLRPDAEQEEDNMLIRVNEDGAVWTVDSARLWRRYIDGPELKQTWAGQPLKPVARAEVEAGWWGRDIAGVAVKGEGLPPAQMAAVAAAAKVGAEAGAGGATPDEVRKIVDEELDEQSLGGADKDS